MHRGYMYGPFSNSYGVNLLVRLIPIILLVLIGIAVYMVFKNNNKQQSSNRALEILDERYAKGEIDEEEYKQRKNTLKK